MKLTIKGKTAVYRFARAGLQTVLAGGSVRTPATAWDLYIGCHGGTFLFGSGRFPDWRLVGWKDGQAREAYGEAGTIIHRLAETIDEGGMGGQKVF